MLSPQNPIFAKDPTSGGTRSKKKLKNIDTEPINEPQHDSLINFKGYGKRYCWNLPKEKIKNKKQKTKKMY